MTSAKGIENDQILSQQVRLLNAERLMKTSAYFHAHCVYISRLPRFLLLRASITVQSNNRPPLLIRYLSRIPIFLLVPIQKVLFLQGIQNLQHIVLTVPLHRLIIHRNCRRNLANTGNVVFADHAQVLLRQEAPAWKILSSKFRDIWFEAWVFPDDFDDQRVFRVIDVKSLMLVVTTIEWFPDCDVELWVRHTLICPC